MRTATTLTPHPHAQEGVKRKRDPAVLQHDNIKGITVLLYFFSHHHHHHHRIPRSSAMGSNITDKEALQALLSSAESREKERNQEHNKRSHRDRPDSRNFNNNNKRQRQGEQRLVENDSYYGPLGGDKRTSKTAEEEEEEEEGEKKPPPTYKPNFGVSGALAKDADGGGNVYKGVVLKFREPPEARAPNTQWRFYVFKKGNDAVLELLHISKQSAYLMGRNADICDIPMLHPSLSSQHAVLQYRALPSQKTQGGLQCHPYIMDLESTNGTFLNGVKIDPARYYQLKKGDVLTFGASTREHVLMTENTTSVS